MTVITRAIIARSGDAARKFFSGVTEIRDDLLGARGKILSFNKVRREDLSEGFFIA